ncbi:polyamine-transporting ATPase 13A3-like [Onthophagus taurus]|uniref:polyamine-transporting ATPase 13A3-like n=1 Tax=Onthophagus taurus TaxID=166361 RepID=UPI0039BE5C86
MPGDRYSSEYELIGDYFEQNLNNGVDRVYTIIGYTEDRKKSIFFHLLCILFLGIPYVIFTWYPNYKVFKFKKSPLSTADILLVNDNSGKYALIKTQMVYINISIFPSRIIRFFTHHHTKFIWLDEHQRFGCIDEFCPSITFQEILENSTGLSEKEQLEYLKFYGLNKIDVEIKSYWRLFIDEVFHPYYIFQVFSIIVWSSDNYVIYAVCILVLSVISAVAGLIETRNQSVALHDLVASSTCTQVQILQRNSDTTSSNALIAIEASQLVPNDLLVIPRNGCVMPCDAVLIAGNCIVNESMLTGESIPVTKTPPHESDEIYNPDSHKRNTLYSGTHIIQSRYYDDKYVLARVIKTGFDTTKGALVKSIMFPTPIGLEFYKDAMKFVLFLFLIAGSGMCYCLYLYINREAAVQDIILRVLDIVTIVVPPALPAAMTVATVYSQNRLKKIGIFCISPARINISGRIKLICFDKTGTLTNDGLDLSSIVPSDNATFLNPIPNPLLLDLKSPLLQGMATCHSLTRINDEITGDPLDLNMFNTTGWELEETGESESTRYDVLVPTIVRPRRSIEINARGDVPTYEIGIIRQFPFSSTLQCMSVICKNLTENEMTVFTKGAPEKIGSISLQESLPSDYSIQLSQFTASGYRVISVGYKKLSVSMKWKDTQKIKREEIEKDLIFVGFIVMQNTLKIETKPVIAKLLNANVRTVMITGDNIETATSVARQCGMIGVFDKVVALKVDQSDIGPKLKYELINLQDLEVDHVTVFNHYHFAIDGKTWLQICEHFSDLIPMLMVRTTVFARFQPDQKTQVVTNLQKLDYVVCMVGDGANDCGALKAAHVGISLSQTEASVAAPFTSKIANISCVIHLMLEGRCALVTTFAEVKYMALYSLIQFFTVLLLYTRFSILGDSQFLYIDLLITMSFALTIGLQGPSKKLVPKRPLGSLVNVENVAPMILQILLCATVQYLALKYLDQQPWFEHNPPANTETILCWENTVLFLVSSFQYGILALLYSKGKPYRQGMFFSNIFLLLAALIVSASIVYFCVCPAEWIANFFEILPMSKDKGEAMFRYSLLMFPLAHFFIAWLIEVIIADKNWWKRCLIPKQKMKYQVLMHESNVDAFLEHINLQDS